jgi:hypothetical protein
MQPGFAAEVGNVSFRRYSVEKLLSSRDLTD